jgi:hypothetical protein
MSEKESERNGAGLYILREWLEKIFIANEWELKRLRWGEVSGTSEPLRLSLRRTVAGREPQWRIGAKTIV